MSVAGIMGRKSGKRRSARRDSGVRNVARPTPISVESVSEVGSGLVIVFNQPVSLNGVPQWPSNGLLPIAAELTSPNTLQLTYPGSFSTPTSVTIPVDDSSVRNTSGGFVAPTTVAL